MVFPKKGSIFSGVTEQLRLVAGNLRANWSSAQVLQDIEREIRQRYPVLMSPALGGAVSRESESCIDIFGCGSETCSKIASWYEWNQRLQPASP